MATPHVVRRVTLELRGIHNSHYIGINVIKFYRLGAPARRGLHVLPLLIEALTPNSENRCSQRTHRLT